MPMCLSNPHVDDSTTVFACRCLHADVCMPMCLPMCLANSHVDDNMLMFACLCVSQTHMLMIACRCVWSNPHVDDSMPMFACRCVCLTHMLMITCRCSHSDVRMPMCLSNSHVDDNMPMCLSNLKFMLPKRRFWKSEPTFPNVCSKQFSTIRRPNRVLTPLKSASKTHSERLVQPSKIFVWGA